MKSDRIETYIFPNTFIVYKWSNIAVPISNIIKSVELFVHYKQIMSLICPRNVVSVD